MKTHNYCVYSEFDNLNIVKDQYDYHYQYQYLSSQ